MNTSRFLQAVASWLENPENEALLLADNNEKSLNIAAEACVKAAAILKQAADEVGDVCEMCGEKRDKEHGLKVECDYEPCGYCGFDHSYEYEDASRWHREYDPEQRIYASMEALAELSSALDESGDEDLQKQASVLDELLLTIAADPAEFARKRAAKDARMEELNKKYHAPTEELKELNKVSDSLKAIKDSKMTEHADIQSTLLSARSCPNHSGAQLQRVNGGWQCELGGEFFDYTAGYTLENGKKVPGSSVEQQTNTDGVETRSIFDTRNERLQTNIA